MRHVVVVLGGVKYPETSIEGRKDTCVLLLDTSSDPESNLHNNLTLEQRLVCNIEKIFSSFGCLGRVSKRHRACFSH